MTEKGDTIRGSVVPVQASQAKKGGENAPSPGASPTPYGEEVVSLIFPEKP